MLVAEDIRPPVQYDAIWPILGVLLVVAVGAWIFYVLYSTRKHLTPQELIAKGVDPYRKERRVYLHKIDAVEQQFTEQTLDDRDVHLELSEIVREFAHVTRGLDTQSATLTDLVRVSGDNPMTELIAVFYHPEFAENPNGHSPSAIASARDVVTRW